MKKIKYSLFILFLILMFSCIEKIEPTKLFVGRLTEKGENGLLLFSLEKEMGTLKLITETDAGPNPSYFCFSKKHSLIYAANEVMDFMGGKSGGVTTLRYDNKKDSIFKLNEIAVPDGSPCYISLSPSEDFLFLANYTGGSINVIKLDKEGIPQKITDAVLFEGVSHPHMIAFDPAGKLIYLTDLGLDRISIYNFDSHTGKLQLIQDGIVKLPSGAGPRHFVFNSDGSKMYVINELNSTITVFSVDEDGKLNSVQTVPCLTDGFKGQSFCADTHIGKNDDFLYGSNRGENTIASFRIEKNGMLSLAGHSSCGGDWPRNFVIDPSGEFILVANQRSGNITVFNIDESTGLPIEPGNDYKLSTPACLKFIK
jgi:6-phosphogluconolactonase